MTNREAHEKAAGMNLSDEFFAHNGIDPDALVVDVKPVFKTIVCNIYGGPGTGKSTTAAGVFHYAKTEGMNAEYVPEYAKEVTWGKLFPKFDDQLYIFAKQHHKMFILQGQVKLIVTDSPLLLSTVYRGNEEETFQKLVLEKYRNFRNFDVFLTRVKPYEQSGRYQDEEGAKAIDGMVRESLDNLGIPYVTEVGDSKAAWRIMNLLKKNFPELWL